MFKVSSAALTGLVCIALSNFALANVDLSQEATSECGVHTWHTITSDEGSWTGTLTVVNQKGSFVNKSCQDVTQFSVSQEKPFEYGMRYELGADFNYGYTLALVRQEPAVLFKQPVCHFYISAMSPGVPQVIPTYINNPTYCNIAKSVRRTDFVIK